MSPLFLRSKNLIKEAAAAAPRMTRRLTSQRRTDRRRPRLTDFHSRRQRQTRYLNNPRVGNEMSQAGDPRHLGVLKLPKAAVKSNLDVRRAGSKSYVLHLASFHCPLLTLTTCGLFNACVRVRRRGTRCGAVGRNERRVDG